MGEKLTIMELRKIRRYLSKVYPGVEGQDELWEIIAKIEKMISEGAKHDKRK